jgi:hypothetical protein
MFHQGVLKESFALHKIFLWQFTNLPAIKLELFPPPQRSIENFVLNLAAISSYIPLLVLIFIAGLCVNAARDALYLVG